MITGFFATSVALFAAACAAVPSAIPRPHPLTAAAPGSSSLTLTSLQCGEIDVGDLNVFSDEDAYPGRATLMVVPCFLIAHGDQLMLWDLGLPDAMHETPGAGPDMVLRVPRTLASQLAELGLAPADIDIIAVSHGHLDHAGNVNAFPDAQLIIQDAEWRAIQGAAADGPLDPSMFAAFADGRNVILAQGDFDVFGDGSVVTISTPGHTPGHQALLVRLPSSGPLILSGDWAHLQEIRADRGVPDFNWNREETLASFDRLEALAAELGAPIVIQHDPADMSKFPKAPGHLD